MNDLPLLWPPPHHLKLAGEAWRVPRQPVLRMANPFLGHAEIAALLVEALSAAGLDPRRDDAASHPDVELTLDPTLGAAETLTVTINEQGAKLIGADPAGLRHAVEVVRQLLAAATAESAVATGHSPALVVAGIELRDWPDLPRRGFMLDVSRDRVPTMARLRELVVLLGRLRINELQLYVEHSFAYAGHETVWQDASPLTAGELAEIDLLCRRHGIELVANQNSLGHLHRWLKHPNYAPLAECPAGVEHPFGHSREPFSLCPSDPAGLALLADLYDQLLPNFSSPWINVGLDETFDLGKGRSADAVAACGVGRVYLDHLLAVHRLVSARGRRMMLWGDIVLDHPELIAELPNDIEALVWGYEADHPFAEQADKFAAAGRTFRLCPGTSSWISLAGRSENALRNLAEATRVAAAHRGPSGADMGCRGVLITDWGDFGHLQPLAVSRAPLVAGAGWAWNVDATPAAEQPIDLARLAAAASCVDPTAPPPGLVRATLELGNAYRRLGTRNRNGSALFFLLVFPEHNLEHPRYRGLSVESLARTRALLSEVGARLAAMTFTDPRHDAERDEMSWVSELLLLACEIGTDRLTAGASQPLAAIAAERRKDLQRQLEPLLEAHREHWLRSARPGGRLDSLAQLERLDQALAAL